MFRTYFPTTYRNLFADKMFSAINIGGLALGLSACMLIGRYFVYLASGGFHPKAPACPASELTIMVGYLGLYEMYDGEKNVQKLPRHGG